MIDIYTRISTLGDRSPGNLQSPDAQAAIARRYIEGLGLDVGQVFHDTQSGYSKKYRAGLAAAVARVEQGVSGGFAVANFDRLSRRDREELDRVDRAGGKVYAPDLPPDLKSAQGNLQVSIMLAFSRYLVETIAERSKAAVALAIADGKVGSPCPLGYRKNDSRLVPDPDVAPLIAVAFQMRLRGEGPTRIADFLNSKGVRTRATTKAPNGNPISYATVQHLLRNRAYLGESRWGPDIVNPNAHEPIVDRQLFDAVQARYHVVPRARPRRGDFWLLSGSVFCGSCGGAMTGTRTTKGRRIYRCRGKNVGGCSNRARVDAGLLETEAEDLFLALTRRVSVRRPKRGPSARELRRLERELEAAERRLGQVLSTDTQDALGGAWPSAVRVRREERDAASAALGAARAVDPVAAEMLTLRQVWMDDGMVSDEDRRRLITHRFPRITVQRLDSRTRKVELTPGHEFLV